MTFRSGKGHRDENFPVASWLIQPRHRALILAFYEFVRCADDIADHASFRRRRRSTYWTAWSRIYLARATAMRRRLQLRRALAERNMSPQHAQDLLKAFRLDATKLRYRDWDDLMGYCAYSAMPVGRFVLDVHGESRSTWPASDAICAALQIINHLQDCAADYRNLDRVYVPLDALAARGLGVEALGAAKASPELRRCLAGLAERTGGPSAGGRRAAEHGRGWAARARALGHPDAGAASHPHAHAARSLERTRASRQARRRRRQPASPCSRAVTRRAGLHRPTTAAQP